MRAHDAIRQCGGRPNTWPMVSVIVRNQADRPRTIAPDWPVRRQRVPSIAPSRRCQGRTRDADRSRRARARAAADPCRHGSASVITNAAMLPTSAPLASATRLWSVRRVVGCVASVVAARRYGFAGDIVAECMASNRRMRARCAGIMALTQATSRSEGCARSRRTESTTGSQGHGVAISPALMSICICDTRFAVRRRCSGTTAMNVLPRIDMSDRSWTRMSRINSAVVARSAAVVPRYGARRPQRWRRRGWLAVPPCGVHMPRVPAHETHAGAHLTRRTYVTRTDAVTDTWGRYTCTDVKRWPSLCIVKNMSRRA